MKKRIAGHSGNRQPGGIMMVRVDEIRWDDKPINAKCETICMIRSRSGMPIANAAASQGEAARRTRKAQPAPNRSPHATSETGRTLTLLLGLDVALMRRSTIISIS